MEVRTQVKPGAQLWLSEDGEEAEKAAMATTKEH